MTRRGVAFRALGAPRAFGPLSPLASALALPLALALVSLAGPPVAAAAGCLAPQTAKTWSRTTDQIDIDQQQSPINIQTSNIRQVGSANFLHKCSWKPVSNVRVTNTGFTVEVSNEEMGYVAITGSDGFPAYYSVAGAQLHMPSLHTVDGHHFAAELHVVHQRQIESTKYDGYDLLITAFFLEVGPDDNMLLRQLYIPDETIPEGSWKLAKQPIDLMRAFGPALDGHFFRYDGSLTIPNCTESVKWFLFETPMLMSSRQLDAFKEAGPNPHHRPLQPVNGRIVAEDSFEDGEPVTYRFYLSRKTGRNRDEPGSGWIVLPVFGSIALAAVIMAASFVRQEARARMEGLSSLVATIGRARYSGV